MEPPTSDPMIAALLRERAGYVTRGLDERVAEVDAQLQARGYTDPQAPAPAGPQTGEKSATPANPETEAGKESAKPRARQTKPRSRT
jgi:hypothetical protein